MYKVQVQHSFLGFKYMRTFLVIGHFTETQIGQVLIRPRLVVTCANGKTRVFSGIDNRDFIVIGDKNGATGNVGDGGESEAENQPG